MQFGIFANAGQVCSATSRLLLHASIADGFLQKLKVRAESIKVSNPLETDCRLGPVVSEGQHKKVLGYIQVWYTYCRLCSVTNMLAVAVASGLSMTCMLHMHCRRVSSAILFCTDIPLSRCFRPSCLDWAAYAFMLSH